MRSKTFYAFLSFAFIAALLLVNVIIPVKVNADTQVEFTQVIREPDCYDQVSVTGNTIDYIATFDCYDRRPDGTLYRVKSYESAATTLATDMVLPNDVDMGNPKVSLVD